MSCLGNVIWFIFGGLIGGLSWLAAGVLWCITIIGIPIDSISLFIGFTAMGLSVFVIFPPSAHKKGRKSDDPDLRPTLLDLFLFYHISPHMSKAVLNK